MSFRSMNAPQRCSLFLCASLAWVGLASAASKGNILVVVSSESSIELKNGKRYQTGYSLNELAVPVKALIEAGDEVTFANPKAMGLQWTHIQTAPIFLTMTMPSIKPCARFMRALSSSKNRSDFKVSLPLGSTATLRSSFPVVMRRFAISR